MASTFSRPLAITLFYVFSISLTFFNEHCIKIFPYPLSITLLHMIWKFAAAWFLRFLIMWFNGKQRVELQWEVYVKTVALAGFASALDIGFSNWSFEFITISLYTMTKSTSIIFIVAFSILLNLEKKKISLLFVVLMIACGLLMFTYESTQFNALGFILVLTASVLSGIRWACTQILLKDKVTGLSDPIDLMYHSQPWMALAILPLSLYIEGLEVATAKNLFRMESYSQLINDIAHLSFGAVLAFCLEISEYLVVGSASSLTLSIAGIFKEICTIYLAAKYNGDVISSINMLGFIICLCGILLHITLKSVDSQTINGKHRS